jgi:hypothetical protein
VWSALPHSRCATYSGEDRTHAAFSALEAVRLRATVRSEIAVLQPKSRQTKPVASNIQLISAFVKSSIQDGGAEFASVAMSQ